MKKYKNIDAQKSYESFKSLKDKKIDFTLLEKYLDLASELKFSASEMWPIGKQDSDLFNKENNKNVDIDQLSRLITNIKNIEDKLFLIHLTTRSLSNSKLNEYNNVHYLLSRSVSKELFTYRNLKLKEKSSIKLLDGLYIRDKFGFLDLYKKEKNEWFFLEKNKNKTTWIPTLLSEKDEIMNLKLFYNPKKTELELLNLTHHLNNKIIEKKSTTKVNEKQKLESTLNELNIPFKEYSIKNDSDFFRDEAIREDAINMISIMTNNKQTLGDYYFNKENKLISFANDSIDSYSKRILNKEKENE